VLLLGAILVGVLAVWLAPQLLVFALGSWVRGQTGRDLAVESARIEWGRETTIDLVGVRLANARWAQEPWMLAVDRVRLRASVGELLRGRGALQALEVSGAALLLEVHGGRGNWDFSDRPAPFMDFGGGGLPRIRSLQLRNLTVRFHDPGRESDILGAIAGASGSLGVPGWRINGQGSLDFKALTFQMQSRGEVVELALNLGETALLARGSPASGSLFIHAEGRDLRQAFPVIPIPFPSTPDYRFDARLKTDGPGTVVLHDLHGRLGATDLAGEVKVTFAALPQVEGSLHSRTLHLRDLKGFIGVPVRGPPPRPGKLFPATPINRQRFNRLRLALDYHADNVIGGRIPIAGVETHVAIEQGLLRLSPLRAALAEGPVHGSAVLDVRGAQPRASMQLELEGSRLSALFAHLPLLDASRGRVRGTLRLAGSGDSLAEIFGASRGELALVMDEGALDRRFVDALSGDLLRLLFGDSERETSRLECAVAVFDVKGGVARADALVAETSGALLTGKGKVDLGRERIDLTLAAEPREPSALSAPTPISVGGTLAKPKISADTSELTGRAAAAVTLGALLGPLAAVAPFTTAGEAGDGHCNDLLARIRNG
jgi:uncharacterized protein involved in outer membrane biogenesis